ncbi:Large eukaryotic DNA virus major capsid protein [seawater metagenome]|uniref:Large eukaryotic DNA virus major capsid protein n=1 Tax=seawater metagenome TaxID=1561972 RepID=A0A5E8CI69_9ZZZZ
MGGGLMQLVATGPQDVYLTGNPQITFFKVMYRRYTNFSTESVQQNFEGEAGFGRTVTSIISKNGDLLTKIYLKVILAATEEKESIPYAYVNKLGHALIDNVKVDLGGTVIDQHYGDWLNIWIELSLDQGKQESYLDLIGQREELTSLTNSKEETILYIPLQFWFCRFNGLALPLIALQYHDVKISVKFSDLENCIILGKNKIRDDIVIKDSYLLVDYVYLDGNERKRFATMPHEYLIEQLQFSGDEFLRSDNEFIKLNFSHPCKSLYWVTHISRFFNNNSSIAINNNGKIDYQQFAKIVWMLTRNGEYIEENGQYYLELDTENKDEILIPSMATNTNSKIVDILENIDAQFLFANIDNRVNLNNLFNVFINDEKLSLEQVSITTEYLSDLFDGQTKKDILNLFSIKLIQPFNYGLYINEEANPILNGELLLNGHSRFSIKHGQYFNYVQPYQHFTRTPTDGINVYSFAINPEEHQPSGSCNMSRIDNCILHLKLKSQNQDTDDPDFQEWYGNNSIIKIYTMNYNVLRIMGGMGGLAYMN